MKPKDLAFHEYEYLSTLARRCKHLDKIRTELLLPGLNFLQDHYFHTFHCCCPTQLRSPQSRGQVMLDARFYAHPERTAIRRLMRPCPQQLLAMRPNMALNLANMQQGQRTIQEPNRDQKIFSVHRDIPGAVIFEAVGVLSQSCSSLRRVVICGGGMDTVQWNGVSQ